MVIVFGILKIITDYIDIIDVALSAVGIGAAVSFINLKKR